VYSVETGGEYLGYRHDFVIDARSPGWKEKYRGGNFIQGRMKRSTEGQRGDLAPQCVGIEVR